MAETIVDALEIVDVDPKQCKRLAVPRTVRMPRTGQALEMPTVVKSGQGVVGGNPLQFLLHLLTLGHVLADGNGTHLAAFADEAARVPGHGPLLAVATTDDGLEARHFLALLKDGAHLVCD